MGEDVEVSVRIRERHAEVLVVVLTRDGGEVHRVADREMLVQDDDLVLEATDGDGVEVVVRRVGAVAVVLDAVLADDVGADLRVPGLKVEALFPTTPSP